MSLSVERGAPGWAQRLARDTEQEISVQLQQLRPLPKFTVASLPPASQYEGVQLYVTNGTGGRPTVTSNGTNWKYGDGTTA